jgi:hypothetical protein
VAEEEPEAVPEGPTEAPREIETDKKPPPKEVPILKRWWQFWK